MKTRYTETTDLTLFGEKNPWRIIHPKTEGYMQEKGDELAEARYKEQVAAALKSYKNLSEEDVNRLYGCAKFFVHDVKDELGNIIYNICTDKSGGSDAEHVARVIDDVGNMDTLFEKACNNVIRRFSGIVGIYAALFMDAYLHEGEKEVFAMLVALPSKLLERISDRLLDTWDYSLSVNNGRLVVYDHD